MTASGFFISCVNLNSDSFIILSFSNNSIDLFNSLTFSIILNIYKITNEIK